MLIKKLRMCVRFSLGNFSFKVVSEKMEENFLL